MNLLQEAGKTQRTIPVGIDSLAEKLDFQETPLGQAADLLEDQFRGSVDFPPAGGGNDAEGAIQVAALHDGDEGLWSLAVEDLFRIVKHRVPAIGKIPRPAETAGLVKDERSLPAKPAIKGFLRSGGPVQKQPASRALQSHIRTSGPQAVFADGNQRKTLNGSLTNPAGGGKYEGKEGIPNRSRSLNPRHEPARYRGNGGWFEDQPPQGEKLPGGTGAFFQQLLRPID